MDLLCARCGAPLPADAASKAVTCAFCGMTSAPPPPVVMVGRLPPIAPREAPPRTPCPRCGDFLTDMRAGASLLLVCRSCNGSWLDAPTVQRLKTARDEDIVRAAQRIAARSLTGAPPDRTVSIACPICKTSLRRERIPGTQHVIDVCDPHGAWFDGGAVDELGQLIEAFERIRSG